MQAIFYIPYVNPDLDENVFEYNGNAFDYLDELEKVKNNIIGADYYFENIPQGNSARFNQGYISQQENNVIDYYAVECVLLDDEYRDLHFHKLIEYKDSGEGFMLPFLFDHENADENAVIELKGWITESKKVMDMPDELYSEDIKMGLLPKRNFKILANKTMFVLADCLFFDIDEGKIILYVNNIENL